MEKKKTNVYVLGGIGSGKTEFAKTLNKHLYANLVLENVSGASFVKKMYEDPKGWALPLQLDFLFDLYRESVRKPYWSPSISVFDSGFPINMMFVQRQLHNGVLYMSDKIVYNDIYKNMKADIEKESKNIFVILNVEPMEALSRIKERGREFEVAMDDEVFLQNHKDIERILPEYVSEFEGALVIEVDNNDLSEKVFMNNILETVDKIKYFVYGEKN